MSDEKNNTPSERNDEQEDTELPEVDEESPSSEESESEEASEDIIEEEGQDEGLEDGEEIEPLNDVADEELQEALEEENQEEESSLDGIEGIEIDDDEILDELPLSKESSTKTKTPEDDKKDLIKNQVEAVLFVSGQAVSGEEISVKLGVSKKIIEDALETLALEYLDRSTCLEIAKVGDKYILQLKPEFTSHVKSFASGGLIREAVLR